MLLRRDNPATARARRAGNSARAWHAGVVLLVSAALVALLSSDADAKAKKRSKLRGKIYFAAKILDRGPAALQRLFKDSKPKASLKREKGKDGHWLIVMAAFFRKKSYPGPMTLWFFDKADKAARRARQAMHVASVSSTPSKVFVHDLDISPNDGFNKGRTYELPWRTQPRCGLRRT